MKNSRETCSIWLDDILDFSKIEADKLELNCAGVALEDCVQGGVPGAEGLREGDRHCLGLLHPKLLRHLLGDEVRLRQIITNLPHQVHRCGRCADHRRTATAAG